VFNKLTRYSLLVKEG